MWCLPIFNNIGLLPLVIATIQPNTYRVETTGNRRYACLISYRRLIHTCSVQAVRATLLRRILIRAVLALPAIDDIARIDQIVGIVGASAVAKQVAGRAVEVGAE